MTEVLSQNAVYSAPKPARGQEGHCSRCLVAARPMPAINTRSRKRPRTCRTELIWLFVCTVTITFGQRVSRLPYVKTKPKRERPQSTENLKNLHREPTKQPVQVLEYDEFIASNAYVPNSACDAAETIVTAYYDIGHLSKHEGSSFEVWNSRFFALLDNMVIFTETSSVNNILKVRKESTGCTLLVLQPLKKTESSRITDWHLQHDKDPEKTRHSTELYIIWNQKAFWLELVAHLNPFKSQHFFWADSGQFRDTDFLDKYVSSSETWIKSPSFLPPCKMVFLSIEKFKTTELATTDDGQTAPLDSQLIRLGGGNFGGDNCAVSRFAALFRGQLHRYLEKHMFVGKDQPVYGSVCTSHLDACFIVDAKKVKEINDEWFALQPVLHGVTAPVPEYVLVRHG